MCRQLVFIAVGILLSQMRGFLTGSISLNEVCTQEKVTCDLLEVT